MAEILNFPVNTAAESLGLGMERYLMPRETLMLANGDPFHGWIATLDAWFAMHPQACTSKNSAMRSLLADTWLIYHMASDKQGALDMKPHHALRWAQLQYHCLSDIELLVIVDDNCRSLCRWLNELCRAHPPETRSDLNLYAVIQGAERLGQQLEKLYAHDLETFRQPEW